MNTKTRKVILLFLIFFPLAVLLESCCNDNYRLEGITSFYAVDSVGAYPNEAIEIIRNDFTFIISLDKYIAGLNVRLVNTASALTCKPNLLNKVLEEDLQLTCNKAFVYDGDTIHPGNNFLDLEDIEIIVDEGNSYTEAEVRIRFTEDFISKVSFEQSLCNFHVTVPTDDGLIFEKEKELLMLLN